MKIKTEDIVLGDVDVEAGYHCQLFITDQLNKVEGFTCDKILFHSSRTPDQDADRYCIVLENVKYSDILAVKGAAAASFKREIVEIEVDNFAPYMAPCPFCDNTELEIHVSHEPTYGPPCYYGWCALCKAQGPSCQTSEEAMHKWNDRAETEEG